MPPKQSNKEEKPKTGLPSTTAVFTELILFVVGAVLISAAIRRIVGYITGGSLFRGSLFGAASEFYSAFKVPSALLSIALGFMIAYLLRKIGSIREEERKALHIQKAEGGTPEEVANYKWQRVVDHIESVNMSDWKLAIIEADIILDEMLSSMGYQGDTVGEKLKQIEKSDFTSIDKAWEAHKVRNLIAHEGSEFILTKKEAVRVIELYKEVFEEFYFI